MALSVSSVKGINFQTFKNSNFLRKRVVWEEFENNTRACAASGVILEGAAMEIDADSPSTPTFALLLFTFLFSHFSSNSAI